MQRGGRATGDSEVRRGGSIPGTRKPAFTFAVPAGFPVPVVLAVPHAGRAYPEELWQQMRRPEWSALRLEDRHVDRLAAAIAQQTGAGLMVAHAPRAMIDLNRASDDVDWTMVAEGAPSPAGATKSNYRAKSGLGLVPRRLPGLGEIWSRPLSGSQLDARIGQVHVPYHQTLEQVLAECRDRWGAALLIDLHSMPPLKPAQRDEPAASYVVGDRFGATADQRIVASVLRELARAGAPIAHNRPYAGGYVLDRHADVGGGIHALQIEVCRSLYLDEDFAEVSSAMRSVAETLAALVRVLAGEIAAIGRCRDLPLAAE